MNTGRKLFIFFFSVLYFFNHSNPVAAEQFLYEAVCHPTQFEDVGRAVRGRLYLALRDDPTVDMSKLYLYVSVQKVRYPDAVWLTEEELLQGMPFSFDSQDLSIAVGGDALGHACLAEANLTVRLGVTRKDGAYNYNEAVFPIRVPGAYATKSKIRIPD